MTGGIISEMIHGKMLAADGQQTETATAYLMLTGWTRQASKSSSCSSDTAFIAFAERSGYK